MALRTPNGTPAIFALALLFPLLGARHAAADDGSNKSGLPVPRFVSLKFDKVNVRHGPTREHDVAWTFTKRRLPVEIIAEFDVWRRIRDEEGERGWVFHSLLSGRRTALVAPWSEEPFFDMHSRADDESPLVARLEPHVLVDIESCDNAWCEVEVDGYEGYVRQVNLWGVYPNETIE